MSQNCFYSLSLVLVLMRKLNFIINRGMSLDDLEPKLLPLQDMYLLHLVVQATFLWLILMATLTLSSALGIFLSHPLTLTIYISIPI